MADIDAAALGLLDGLEGAARRDRAELVAWLLERGFTVEQIRASLAPMLLPANRLMGDDGVHVSAREVATSAQTELQLLERLQRAVGLPRIDDPDAAVLPRVDIEAAARTRIFADYGLGTDEAIVLVRVLMHRLRRTAATMREAACKVLIRPGATEVEIAQTAEDRG